MLDYVDYLKDFDRDIRRTLDILFNEDLDFVNAKTKEAAPSSHKTYNNNMLKNFFNAKFIAF